MSSSEASDRVWGLRALSPSFGPMFLGCGTSGSTSGILGFEGLREVPGMEGWV